VLARKAFPHVIDKMGIDAKQNYEYKMFNSYVDVSAQIGITSKVSNGCAIAAKIQIGRDCSINSSTIGTGCRIGKNVKIENSIIDADVEIKDNCSITNAII